MSEHTERLPPCFDGTHLLNDAQACPRCAGTGCPQPCPVCRRPTIGFCHEPDCSTFRQDEFEEAPMTEHTDSDKPVKFPALIERTTCDCEWHVEGVLAVRCLQCSTVERIAAWLDGFNHQQWRPAYATTTQEASRQFADAIRRGEWKGEA